MKKLVINVNTGETREELIENVQISINELKNFLLKELEEKIILHILKNYSEIKQRSDVVDKEYYQNYLISIGVNEMLFRTEIQTSASNIYNGNLLTDEVNRIITILNIQNTFNNYTAVEQLLKVAVRVVFVQKCKEIYRQTKQLIESATTETELPDISTIQLSQLPAL